MILKRTLIFVSIILVVAMLGACVRSASTPPVSNLEPPTSQPTEEASPAVEGKAPEGQPQPEVTNEVLQQLAQFVTQTAAAAQLAGGQVPGQPQPGGTNAEGTPYPVMETPAQAVQATQGAEAPAGQESSPETTQSAEATQSAQATQVSEPAGGQQPAAPQPTATSQPSGGQQPAAPQPTATSQPSGGQQPAAPQPTQSVKIVVPSATPGIPTSYTLQPGEFPYCIARRFNVNPFELLSINGLTTSSVVRGGTTLRIPQTGNHFPGERALMSHPTTYQVGSGENIYMVACKFGDVSPDAIAYANNISAPYTVTAGQTLSIP